MEDGRTLPWRIFTDPEQLGRERERIFAAAWHYAGHAGLVAEPSSFAAVQAAHVPVVLVRDREGELRGFVNVCRHRGHPVAVGSGRRETLQCPYHGWTYGLDGALRAAPRAEREPGLDLAGVALRPVRVDTWGPLVFVNASPAGPSLAEVLGPLPGLVDPGGLVFRLRAEVELRANWKLVCENYLECYHCPVAHPRFSRLVDVSPEAYRLEASGSVLSQYGPARADGALGQFHLLWPGTVVNVYPGRPNLSIGSLAPLAPDRTARFLDYFFAPGEDEAWVADLLALDEEVGRQDAALVEAVQRGVSAGLVAAGRLLPESERLVAAFERLVRDALA